MQSEKPKDDMALVQEQSEEDGKRCGFMDLSAELRNEIYRLCLTAAEDVEIDKWSGVSGVASLSPNLLATCKTIHNEATAILYGSNHFQLCEDGPPRAEIPWLQTIGKSIEYLRAITVHTAWKQNLLLAMLKDLKSAKSLEKLVCGDEWPYEDGGSFSNFRSAKATAKGLQPLLLQLHKARKGTNKKPVIEMLEIRGQYGAEAKEILKKKIGASY